MSERCWDCRSWAGCCSTSLPLLNWYVTWCCAVQALELMQPVTMQRNQQNYVDLVHEPNWSCGELLLPRFYLKTVQDLSIDLARVFNALGVKIPPCHLLVCHRILRGLSATSPECQLKPSAQLGQACAIANASWKRTQLAAMRLRAHKGAMPIMCSSTLSISDHRGPSPHWVWTQCCTCWWSSWESPKVFVSSPSFRSETVKSVE